MNDAILTSLLGLGTAAAGAFVTYLTTRRKYNADVDATKMENYTKEMESYKTMLDFYQKLLDDNNRRLSEMIEENHKLREAAKMLHEEMSKLQKTTPATEQPI